MKVTATPGNVQLNTKGHYAKSSLVHSTKDSTTLGQTQDLLQGNWRCRNNNKPIVVLEKPVDTTGCL